jgi:Icc-related predicted phosphoesterase
VIRVAAVGDLHAGEDSAGCLRPHFEQAPECADVLVLAGDLTRLGTPGEVDVLVGEVGGIGIPTVAVLGNHDYHSNCEGELRRRLEGGGIRVLEGEATVVEVDGSRLGIAGAKGFGGGFAGACATEFGEPETKAFVRHTRDRAERLEAAIRSLDGVDHRLVLLHYAPVDGTLAGERREIYPFLGSYLLGQAVDAAGADLVIHGHAHAGSEQGETPGGIPVRNVAQPVLGGPFKVYCLGCD